MTRLFAIMAALFIYAPAHAQEVETIPYLDAVPVMSAFTILEDSILVFDKPEGQIAEISMMCEQSCPDKKTVHIYYNDVLKGMGWVSDGENHFFKGQKYIRIDYSKTNDLSPSVILTFHSKG